MIYDPIITGLSLLSMLFITVYAITLKRLYRLTQNFDKLLVEHIALQKIIDLQSDKTINDQEVHRENFIKFLSDSRDWAYQYIEDVQLGLTKFVDDVEPEINYFKEYGDISSMEPNYFSLKKIVESYYELKKLLPEDHGVDNQ